MCPWANTWELICLNSAHVGLRLSWFIIVEWRFEYRPACCDGSELLDGSGSWWIRSEHSSRDTVAAWRFALHHRTRLHRRRLDWPRTGQVRQLWQQRMYTERPTDHLKRVEYDVKRCSSNQLCVRWKHKLHAAVSRVSQWVTMGADRPGWHPPEGGCHPPKNFFCSWI